MFELVTLPRIKNALANFHRDERGLTVVEIILLISLIVLPIILLLVFFGKDIKRFITQMWSDTKDQAQDLQSDPFTGS